MSVVTNDDTVNTKTRTITVEPNDSDSSSSTITFDNLIVVGSDYIVVTQIYDKFGNEVTEP